MMHTKEPANIEFANPVFDAFYSWVRTQELAFKQIESNERKSEEDNDEPKPA